MKNSKIHWLACLWLMALLLIGQSLNARMILPDWGQSHNNVGIFLGSDGAIVLGQDNTYLIDFAPRNFASTPNAWNEAGFFGRMGLLFTDEIPLLYRRSVRNSALGLEPAPWLTGPVLDSSYTALSYTTGGMGSFWIPTLRGDYETAQTDLKYGAFELAAAPLIGFAARPVVRAGGRNTFRTVDNFVPHRVMNSTGFPSGGGRGSQALLDTFIEGNPLFNQSRGGLNLTVSPSYVSDLGEGVFGNSTFRNGKFISRISDPAFSSNRQLIDTIAHEDLHLRIVDRISNGQGNGKWLKLRNSGQEEQYVRDVIERFMRGRK